ncbi:membrane-associated progesterone receptor component 1 [Linderina pennispora]|uniref:Membrane-associated progesterone receptor component 1 n=1 Tax=Linderina pennispora TaxID=61395 RepID=A0A1Y1WED4_9FUNG|nr:membrane-associated progesterone receptor component 1 [Linderina pennispora]ORX71877.1 membrane-associated progesterone receptor component 1 [Linderina pennispora]
MAGSTVKTVVALIALYYSYKAVCYLWTKDTKNQSRRRAPLPYRKYTKRELSQFTGENNTPVLIGLAGKVYDVSAGRGFYGPGGPYNLFAGRDASRLLATQSFDEGITEEELDAPIDKLEGLTEDDLEQMDAYIGLFNVKYLCVGELVEPTAADLAVKE